MAPRAAPAPRAELEPLAPERYRVQFTASAELREKLARLQALMRSSVPDGNLAVILEQCVTEKLERLEAKRFAKTKAPRKSLAETDTSASSRYIPAAVRRVVHERDEDRCTFACRARAATGAGTPSGRSSPATGSTSAVRSVPGSATASGRSGSAARAGSFRTADGTSGRGRSSATSSSIWRFDRWAARFSSSSLL